MPTIVTTTTLTIDGIAVYQEPAMTRTDIVTAIQTTISRHYVTEDAEGNFRLPGLLIGEDANVGGWMYREAVEYDADRDEWGEQESGGIDDLEDIRALLGRAIRRLPECIATAAIRALQNEAGHAGDEAMGAVCNRALNDDVEALAEVADVLSNALAQV